MYTHEIEAFMKNDRRIQPCFRGVYAVDELPVKPFHRPALYIINTDLSTLPGEHWIAIYFPAGNEKPEYFDSFGRPPSNPFVISFLASPCRYNARIIQAPTSETCGYHVLHFAYFRCRNWTLHQIINRFGNDLYANDTYVKHFVNWYF